LSVSLKDISHRYFTVLRVLLLWTDIRPLVTPLTHNHHT